MTAEVVIQAQADLGTAFPDWVHSSLPLSVAEADLFIRLANKGSGLSEGELSPARAVKFPRLLELIEELVRTWHSQASLEPPFESLDRSPYDELPRVAEAG